MQLFPLSCICRQSAWRVRREWRTARVVGNSGRYCGTWAVGLTPPLRRSPRVLTAGMLNVAFASEFARFLFSSSRQWTTFPSASSVSTIDRLFASAVTSTSLRLEGRPATDRRRRLFHGPMHTYITIHLYTPIYTYMMSWCLMSSDVIWHIRDKLWPMPKHGSIILYVHGNQKGR